VNSDDPVLEFCGDVFRPINLTNNSPKDETINLTNNHCEGNYLEKTIVEKKQSKSPELSLIVRVERVIEEKTAAADPEPMWIIQICENNSNHI